MNLLDEVKAENDILIKYIMQVNDQHQQKNNSHVQIPTKVISRAKPINKINSLQCKQFWLNNLQIENLKQIIRKLQHKLQQLGQCQYVNQLFLEIQKLQNEFLKKYRQIIIIEEENTQLKKKIQNISSHSANNHFQKMKKQIQSSFQEENKLCSNIQYLKQSLQLLSKHSSSNQQLINHHQIDNILTNSTPKHQMKQSNNNISFYLTQLTSPKLDLDNNKIRSMSVTKKVAKQSTNEQIDNAKMSKLEAQNQCLSQKIKSLEEQLYSTQLYIRQLNNSNSYISSVENNIKLKNQQIQSLNLYIKGIQGQLQQKDICLKKKDQTIKQLEKVIQQLDHQRNNQNDKYKSIIESKNNQLNNLSLIYKRKVAGINLQLEKSNQIVDQLKILINKYEQVEEINQHLTTQIKYKQQEIHCIKLQNKNLKSIIQNLKQIKPYHQEQKVSEDYRHQVENKNNQIKLLINDLKSGLDGKKQHTQSKLLDSIKNHNGFYNSHSMLHINKSPSNIQIKKFSTNTTCFDNLNQKGKKYNQQKHQKNNVIYVQKGITYKKQVIKPVQQIAITNRQDNKCSANINVLKSQKIQYIEKKISNLRKENKNLKRGLLE